MPVPARDLPIDYEALAEVLAALAYPARLELMDVLRFPQNVNDIRIAPRRSAPGENPERAVSRPTLLAHLEKLIETDLVRIEGAGVRGGQRYHANPQRLFAILEELRTLSLRYAGKGPAGDETEMLDRQTSPDDVAGPRLVLVHGVYEGQAYPLEGDGPWTIGRRKGHSVWLDYDPYVSLDNAQVERDGDGFRVVDLPESRNGTRVNWRPLRDGPRRLKPGDVIGVGRSLLAYAAE